MGKIVFFDIDGTLLDDNKNLPKSAQEAIYKLRENGVFVAFATGRAPFMLDEIKAQLEIDSYVAFNGQYVVLDGKVIYTNPICKKDLEQFALDSAKNGHPLVYLNETTMKASTSNHFHIEKSMQTLRFPYPKIDDSFFNRSEIYQTLVFCDENEEHYYVNQYDQFDFIRWHRYSLDVVPSGASKAAGIEQIVTKLGSQMSEVYAFGDGNNDIEMIQAVGTGIVMENAVPELKKHADIFAKRVTEGGISETLKKLALI